MGFEVLFLLAIPLFAGIIWLGWWTRNKEIARFTAHAAQLGFSYLAKDRDFLRDWRGMPFVSGGRISDIFSGTVRGVRAQVFRYTYEEDIDDKNTRTIELLMAVADLPLALPETRILHETVGAKLTKLLGAQDIQFESSAFNDAFLVKGADRRATHALIDPRMMEFLLRSPARSFQVRTLGSRVLMWQPESVLRAEKMRLPEAVAPMADLVVGFVEHVPAHLLRQR